MWKWRRQKLPLILLLALGFNIAIVPLVFAATVKLEPRHTYTITGLGIIILGLIIYLFDVVFRPERY
jgi:K+-transporting ATPase KdpF subunit